MILEFKVTFRTDKSATEAMQIIVQSSKLDTIATRRPKRNVDDSLVRLARAVRREKIFDLGFGFETLISVRSIPEGSELSVRTRFWQDALRYLVYSALVLVAFALAGWESSLAWLYWIGLITFGLIVGIITQLLRKREAEEIFEAIANEISKSG